MRGFNCSLRSSWCRDSSGQRTLVRVSTRSSLRQALLAIVAVALLDVPATRAQTPDLTAGLRIFESSTAQNSFPDDCDMRLDRLYVAEGLELSIGVQFSRDLSDDEAKQVQWRVADDAGTWSTGDFEGQPNPALVTTTLGVPIREGDRRDAMVHVLLQGVDIAPPAPMRVVTDQEYDAALATLANFTDVGSRPRGRLPLTVDLLARFLGQGSDLVGSPSVGAEALNICDPRLTQRAGANWGADTVTDVPIVEYAPDQPASEIVAEAAARALLAQHEDDIRQYFDFNPQARTYPADFTYSGNLTLNRPLDAALALHGVQFEGTLTATVDAPAQANAPLVARDVHVTGSVGDLYDFDLEAGGAGALPAAEAAKVEIASVKHATGKVFLVSFNLASSFESLDL
jgi:hypothetical protein